MAARKLQQEIDKEFKKCDEGVLAFESVYDKLTQSTNPSQKEKLEDALKKEIKKLQRSRDKIKGWAGQNDIKDKKPLLDKRKLIETQMEKFKAVEKEMKTKAFSKEGLSAATKLDPKEKEKLEVCQFLSDVVDELGRQVESHEAEMDNLQAGIKKKKNDNGKADRLSELERTVERHKWHVSKLEILLRSVENGSVDTEQVKDIEDGIKYYVEQNQEVDFMEDDAIYDDLNLEEEEDQFGLANENDKGSSQDAQSVQDEPPENEAARPTSQTGAKAKPSSESNGTGGRRPSMPKTTPLPVLSSLQTTSTKPAENMKPAPLPSIPTGQTLKYASAAAAAAASENGVGIAPLPPPPGASKSESTSSPAVTSAQLSSVGPSPQQANAEPAAKAAEPQREESRAVEPAIKASAPQALKTPSVKPSPLSSQAQLSAGVSKAAKATSHDSGVAGLAATSDDVATAGPDEEEAIYHLPSGLADLLESFEETKKRSSADQALDVDLLNAARLTCPTPLDAERPNHYKPQNPYAYTPAHYPQEPLGIFDDARLYGRIDTDSLFYGFYYRQGTYQQYLSAKALKSQSWRFHKQYQTWFQRHEEPKNITEEFEQGTYRFFDYESTWMNRRKADFKFAYKFLEDDL